MRTTALFVVVLLAVFLATDAVYSQNTADTDAINILIDKYSAFEDAGDMVSQAKLMTKDRVWIGGLSGRRTNQSMNMEIQQAGIDEAKKWAPGVKRFTEARDRLIKLYGNGSAAVASFYWHTSRVLPADMPQEKADQFGPLRPTTVTLVLEKQGGNWKIVHTHSSPLGFAPPANN